MGRFRRDHLVPVPACESYDALNRLLLDACAQDDGRHEAHRVRLSNTFHPEITGPTCGTDLGGAA
ncbi:MAG: hypothetical protein EXR76_17560 [Myxococcales bacterium]|nr:hypothetical protein [Myxococcales bacterium]